MKLIDHFSDLLDSSVNLNKTRIDKLESSVDAIKGVVASSDWKPKLRTFEPQGSWVHKTIIKPIEGGAFDADLLAVVDPVAGWTAKTYVESLRDIFARHGTYADKVKMWDYCITLTYAGDFKLDLAPCIRDRHFSGYEVCNRLLDEFQSSRPIEYTTWLVERNSWTGNNAFRKVTKLLKYLRDIKTTFTCPSILLTTLLGHRIGLLDSNAPALFSDTPTALKTIIGRLDDWLQACVIRPLVQNPVLPLEDFGRLWTEDQYSNFRDKVHTYRTWIDDAYDEADRDESIGKWRRVFGEEFAKSVDTEAAAIGRTAAMVLSERHALGIASYDDMVSLLVRHGRAAIPPNVTRLPYMRRPKWKARFSEGFTVSVAMSLYDGRQGSLIKTVSDLSPLAKGCWIQLRATASSGLPLSREFSVFWRVTNTDKEATMAGNLRGGFYLSNDDPFHWEELRYRGLHLVEAYPFTGSSMSFVTHFVGSVFVTGVDCSFHESHAAA